MHHDAFMKQALVLAKKAHVCDTLPNPRVGAVIVKDGRVISTGYHKMRGFLHAERDALGKLSFSQTRGTTLYCTLEPCCGTWSEKKQAPCVEAIIRSGITHVYIAATDPNPKVCRRGIEALRGHNIHVEILSNYTHAEKMINEAIYALYASAQIEKKKLVYTRPFVHAKIAQSLDARMAAQDGSAAWISNAHARKKVHEMRSQTHMLCTGVDTIIKDNPSYSVRHVRGTSPSLAIFDSMLQTPPTAHVFTLPRRDPSVVIFTTEAGYDNKTARHTLERVGAHIVCVNSDDAVDNAERKVAIAKALRHCVNLGVYTIMLEAGATLTKAFLTRGFVDKLSCFIAPLFLGGSTSSQRYALSVNKVIPSMNESIRLSHVRVSVIKSDEFDNANCLLSGYARDIFSHNLSF